MMNIQRAIMAIVALLIGGISLVLPGGPASATFFEDILARTGIIKESNRQIVYQEKIQIAGRSMLVILDIKNRNLLNEPMDYDRIRIYRFETGSNQYHLAFEKRDVSGVVFEKGAGLQKTLLEKYPKNYFLAIEMMGHLQLMFIEWPYNLAGQTTIIGGAGKNIRELFSETAQIEWRDVDHDGSLEILARDWLEVGLSPEVFGPDFHRERVYKYSFKREKYLVDKKLTKEWLLENIGQRLKKYEDEQSLGNFEFVILTYLKLEQCDNALKFYDRQIKRVKIDGAPRLDQRWVREIREAIQKNRTKYK